MKTTFAGGLVLGTALLAGGSLQAADVTYERLQHPEPQNWLMNHHDYSAQRFSSLDAINKSNVKNLKLKFAVALGVRAGTAGRIVWKMDPGQERLDRNRGVALWGNLVISITSYDGRVIATDKETGKVVWDKNLRDQPDLELTAAPLALKDSIIIGASGGDRGLRDWISALDAKTGNLRWKTYSIPAPGEPGNETWRDKNNAWQSGGGAFYVTGSYD